MKTLRRPFTRSLSVLLLLCLLFTLPAVALAGSDNQNAPILSGTSQVQPPTNAEVLAEFVLSQDLSKVFTDKEIKAILADDGNFGLHAEVFSTDEEEDIFNAKDFSEKDIFNVKDFSTTPVVGEHSEYTASENVKAASQKRVCSGEGVVLELQGRAKYSGPRININLNYISVFNRISQADILKAAEIVGREFLQNPSNSFDANAYMAEKLRALVDAGYATPNKTAIHFGQAATREEAMMFIFNELTEPQKEALTKAVLGLAIKNAQLDAGLAQAAADGVFAARILDNSSSDQIEEEEIEDVPQ